TVTRTVNVVDTGLPVITLLGIDPVTIEVGGTYTDAGATATDNYDGDLTSSIVVSGSVDVNTLGVYTLSYDVTDSSSNAAVTVTRTVNVVDNLSVNDVSSIELIVYPNPTSSNWNLKSNISISSIQIFDFLGRQVYSMCTNQAEVFISTEDIPSGSYFLIVNRRAHFNVVKY
ncbi:immunoglobulin-like domain-containing protein, partial [Nonlabens sp.]|uniref:DUF5011 domain-containing protein n=1 Tax=Nonlabens sp. TaxID=1888209 RepID=UPI003F6962C9